MKQNLIMDIVQGMLPYLNNAQTQRLQEVLQHTLFDYEVAKTESDKGLSEQNLVELFLSAKRIEGCSEKTLKYYKATIQAMIDSIGKGIKYIVTDDIRCYLTEYQSNKNSSKVTIDNINIDKSYGSPGGYDGEVIETMEDLFLLALFEIYTNCVL